MEAESNFLSEKYQQSIKKLELFLNEECSKKPIKLNERQVRKYKNRGAATGWAIQPPHLSRRLIIFVDTRYPFSVPKTAIDPPFPALSYPHIEKDGYLCVSEMAVPKSEEKLEAVAASVIAESIELIKNCISGKNQDDFKDEILSYWDRAKSADAPKCYSLLDLFKDKTSRKVRIWKGIGDKKITFIAETKQEGELWLNQKVGKKQTWNSTEAFFVWSDKILTPKEYPENNKQVYDFLRNSCEQGALKLFQELAAKTPDEIYVVIGFTTNTGNALVSVILERPKASSSKKKTLQALNKGFRPGRINPKVAGIRYANAYTEIKRLNVERVDPSWSLFRDSNKHFQSLKDKSVTIIGCGSIGSEIARLLAQNGVCAFNFIDPDVMDWENIGRHVLGADSITFEGKWYKVELLGKALKAQFPHITIKSMYHEKWEEIVKKDNNVFHGSDLIVMATGDWPAENAMNKYALAQNKFPPILYGWAEAYAAAGHSFAVLRNGGCFNCAFEETLFRFKLTEFENEQKLLPACGGVFQPFRSIELAPINSIIGAHAVDILLGKVTKSQIRSWIGSQDILIENGGKWTDTAERKIKDNGATPGQFLIQMDFNKSSECNFCGTNQKK